MRKHVTGTLPWVHKPGLLILFVLLLQVPLRVAAQKVSYTGENVPLEKIFKSIHKQTGYVVFCSRSLLQNSKKVTLDLRNVELKDFLDKILKEQSLEYAIEKKTISVTKKAAISAVQPENDTKKEPSPTGMLQGRVVNEKGDPLSGVTVAVKDGRNMTATDNDGAFTLKNADAGAVLVFSYTGYTTVSQKFTGRKSITITMNPGTNALDDIVIIGYGSVKKSDVTGAVSRVKGSDLPKEGSPSVGNMLQGKAAGLVITSNNASPGGALNFRIRGADNDPLIIIDGFPVTPLNDTYFSQTKTETGTALPSIKTDNNFTGLNPDDIETIDILKDASATSIYGSRAANGVILITTKRGKGSKLNVTYSNATSIQQLYGLPKVLNGKDFMVERNKVFKEVWMNNNNVYPYGTQTWDDGMNSGIAYPYSDQDIQNFKGGTDWVKEITRTGLIQSHNFNLTAGTDKTKYLFSVSSFDNKAVIKSNGFNRLTVRLNLDQEFNKWLTGGITSSYSRNKFDNVFGESNRSAGAQFAGVISSALEYNPLIPVKDSTGQYALNPDRLTRPNPVSLLDALDKTDRGDLLVNSYVEATPFKGLSIRGSLGIDMKTNNRNTYLPTTISIGNQETGLAYIAENKREDWLYNLRANYNFQLNSKHKFTTMAALEFQQRRESGLTMLNSKFPTDDFTWNNMGTGARTRPDVTSYLTTGQRASYISRITYSYNDKYLLTANLRVDGSSNFARNKQWGKFPGVSVAWKISEERFLKEKYSWLSLFKLRAGYGLVGDESSLYGTYSYFNSAGTAWSFNNVPTSGLGLANIGNPNLSWETFRNFNLGLDFGFFRDRISGSVELYRTKVYDAIGQRVLPINQELSTINYNLSEVQQKRGFEFTLNTVNIANKNFRWTTNINYTFYRNSYLKRDANYVLDINQNAKEDIGGIWKYVVNGMVPAGNRYAGALQVKDINGYLRDGSGQIIFTNGKPSYSGKPDGVLDNADMLYIGNNTPIPFSINNTFKYKSFDVNIYFYGMLNNWMSNSTFKLFSGNLMNVYNYGENTLTKLKGRMSFDNLNSTIPSMFSGSVATSQQLDGYYLEKASFLRFQNLSMGYTFPKKVIKGVFSNLRVYASARNLFVITSYSGSDPETDSQAAYPNQRTYTLGAELKF